MKVLKWVRIAVFLLALVLVLAHVAGEEEEEGNFVGRSEHYAELNHLGRLEEAVEAAAEAAALAPQDPNVLSDLGALLQQLNRLDEAQAVLLAALKIEPNHFNALNNLAVTLIAAGSLVEAEVPLRRALLLVQGSSSTESAVFHNLVSLLRDSGRQEEAEVELRGMMELPEGPAGDFLLAVAQLHLQRSRHLYRVGNLAKEYGIPVDQDGYEDLWTQLMKLQHSFPSSINTLVAWRGYRGDLLDASKIYLDLSLPDAVMTPMEEAAKFGPAGTGIHLIVQYYLAGDKARQREMDDCLIM
jgi:tetratricopeptide (TPR) repeat protein